MLRRFLPAGYLVWRDRRNERGRRNEIHGVLGLRARLARLLLGDERKNENTEVCEVSGRAPGPEVIEQIVQFTLAVLVIVGSLAALAALNFSLLGL